MLINTVIKVIPSMHCTCTWPKTIWTFGMAYWIVWSSFDSVYPRFIYPRRILESFGPSWQNHVVFNKNLAVSRCFKMRSTPAISNSKTVKPVITGQRGQNKKVIKLVRSFNFQTVYFNKADFLRKFIFVLILIQANNFLYSQ